MFNHRARIFSGTKYAAGAGRGSRREAVTLHLLSFSVKPNFIPSGNQARE